MQVIKPQALGLSTRPIEYRKRFGLCVTAMLHLPFAQAAQGTLWGEQSMWNFLGTEMAVPMIDEGVNKLTPEYLVHGRAYPPSGADNACAVRAAFAGLEKTLLVFGERHWEGDRASAPGPFDTLPIDWAHAFGGAGHPVNPEGMGLVASGGRHMLPHIEHPGARLLGPQHRVEPAGFGLLGPMHPQRVRLRGTYDADYLKQHSPGFAPDLDWRYFNLAPTDQWLSMPLRGDEAFAFDHMHPTRAHLKGQLPGLRARVFADYRLTGADKPRLREVPMRLTTAWFFPHAERCILLFHGLAEVASDDAADVYGLLGAVERVGEAKEASAYLELIARRADPRWGAIESLDDSGLLPDQLDTFDPESEAAQAAFSGDGLQEQAQYRRAETDVALAREEVRASGRDPDALGITMPPREVPPLPAQRARYMRAQVEAAEREQLHAVNDLLIQLEKAIALGERHAIDPATMAQRGPPRYSAEAELARLQTAAKQGGRVMNTPWVYGHLLQKEGAEAVGYLLGAHEQAPAPSMASDESATLRDEMQRAVAGGLRYFRGVDFTGANFSGLDLRGVDFSGAWLESTNFTGANLSGANLSHAVLAHAGFDRAIAIGTDFRHANLGRTRCTGAVFDEADFSGAILASAQLGDSALRRSLLKDTDLLGVTLAAPADWRGLRATGQLFYRLDLKATVLAEAHLDSAQFIECNLADCDMTSAHLAQANFLTCALDGARLAAAQAPGVVFAERCSMLATNFSQAVMPNANFGAAELGGACFVGARLDGANLCEARMAGCDMRLASAQGALLRRAVLRGANLAGVNLRDAMLQHADLRSADLRNTLLFGADLSRVRLNAAVRLENARFERARTWPRLTAAEQAQST